MSQHGKVGDLFTIRKGRKMREVGITDNNSADRYLPYLQIEDLRDDSNPKYCETSENAVTVEPGDIVIAWDGANAGTSNFGLKGAIGSTLARLRLNHDNVYTPFVGAFVQYREPYLRATCTGATIPHIHRQSLIELIVPLPEMETQKKIADTLNVAQELIDKRQRQIELLDEFLESVFLDMFGDPMTNPKGWDVTNLGNLARLQGGYAFKSSDYKDDGVRLVRITNVHRDFLDWSDVNYLPWEYHTKYEPYALADGDILMAMTRPVIQSLDSVKVVKVTLGDLPCLLNQRVGRFIITDSRLSREYLYWFCLSSYFKNEIEKFSSVSLQPNVSSRQVEEILMCIPPLALQGTFAEIVDKVVIRKRLMEQGMAEMQNLFNSIMQRAFKGELFN